MRIKDEEYDRLNSTIDELRNKHFEQQEEIESLSNTVSFLEKYRQRCKELENENYLLKIDKQNLIGLRDALNRRIEELEDQINEYELKR